MPQCCSSCPLKRHCFSTLVPRNRVFSSTCVQQKLVYLSNRRHIQHTQEKPRELVLISLTPLFLFIWVEGGWRDAAAVGVDCAPSWRALSLLSVAHCVSLLLLNADRPVTHFADLDSQFHFSAHEVNLPG